MSSLRILVVEDEPAIRQVLAAQVSKAGHEVDEAGDGASAVKALSRGDIELCICDIRLPDFDGIEVMRRTRESGIETTFLMMTAYASVDTAMEALQGGAYDYLTKPLRFEDVLHRISQIGALAKLQEENRRLRDRAQKGGPDYCVSESVAMQQVERVITKVARTSGTLLITGESGTGKSFIARRIHRMSEREDCPFVSINCGAIPENLLESEFFGHIKGSFTGAEETKKGLFREADEGTLFLDEIGELPHTLQVKLLHVLEEREVRPVGSEKARKIDVRILAATNRDIEKMVADGSFREDLYYRLNVVRLNIPALRERREDLPLLIQFFLQGEAKRLGLEQEFRLDPIVEEILLSYPWKGNLRELQNVIARAMVLAEGDEITIADLPSQVTTASSQGSITKFDLPEGGTLRDQTRRFELQLIRRAVTDAKGDRQAAANKLGIGVSTLYRKLDESENTPSSD